MKKNIIIIAIIMLLTACTTTDTEPTNQAATITINATTEAFDGAATRATTDIKTNFLPGDEIEIINPSEGKGYTYQYTTAATWEPKTNNDVLALPLSPTYAIELTAKYPTGPDPLIATASTTDGTITLTIDPTTGQPQWNIALSFTHTSAVVDVIVMDPQMNIITHLMQSVTINDGTPSNTPTNILLPAAPVGSTTTVSVTAAGITYNATTTAEIKANTRYTLAFVCNPTTPTVTVTNGPNWTEGETGTVPAGYHYYIYTKDDLQAWADDTKNIGSTRKAIQMANIEWTPTAPDADWTPISFSGVYNGNGHTITGLKITTVGSDPITYSGMFGYVSGGAILTGIHLRGATIDTTIPLNITNHAGLLAGHADGATISLCSAQGTITNNGGTHVGGLVGSAGSSTTRTSITRCYADATITHTPSDTNSHTGGLVGWNGSTIVACGANTNITVTDNKTDCYAGGLVGENNNSNIYFCYATGTVNVNVKGSTNNRYAGGLVGRNNNNSNTAINYCYATAIATGYSLYTGTLIGNNAGTITNCHAPAGTTVGNAPTHSGVFTDGTDHKPKDVVRGENVNITSIPTIHRDPTTGYHDALYPIAATFNANNVWTEANYPTINYNYNGGR